MKFLFFAVMTIALGCASTPVTQVADDGDTQTYSFNATLDGFPYPFEVERFALKSQGQELTMAYMDLAGDNENSQTVVLLHGKNFSGYYYEQVARDLHKSGYRVVIPDQVGFGKSTKPADYQYSFEQLAQNTRLLLDSLGIESYMLVGHSMGGMLATHMAAAYPAVSKLILINPIGLEDYLQYVHKKETEFFLEIELAKTPAKVRAYQQNNYYDGVWNPAYDALLVPFIGWYNGPDYELIAKNAARTYGPIFNEEIVSILETIEKEVHLILGTRDRTAPGRGWKKEGAGRELGRYDRLGDEIVSKNSNIQLHKLEGLGHLPQYEDYESFKAAFLPIFD